MRDIPRWLVLALLITAALVCYAIGFSAGFGVFLIAGVVFELLFWMKIFAKKRNSKET